MDTIDNINYISAPDKDFCDHPITLAEILESIKYLKVNKSPGIDGLTSEFYQRFAKDLAPFLLEIIYESIRVVSRSRRGKGNEETRIATNRRLY